MSTRKKRLAKDLDLLIGISKAELPVTNTTPAVETASTPQALKEGLVFIPLEHLQRGKYQPRREFEKAALAELASSIRTDGVMQPIVVRAISTDKWEIIAGERRWRASQLAGIDRIPAIVREVSDEFMKNVESLKAHTLLNQSVLLKGVNDSAKVLSELSSKLFESNILPYYVHLLDKVSGADRFLVTDKRAKEIYKTLQTLLPGYLVPRMVRDEGGYSKRLVL